MAETPSGMLSGPMDEMRTLLANCSAFQTWTGVMNATAAKSYIQIVGAAIADEPELPFARISLHDDWSMEKVATGSWIENGALELAFFSEITEANVDTPIDESFEHLNEIGAIFANIQSLSGSDAYLEVTRISKSEMGVIDPSESNADGNARFASIWRVDWGLN